MKRLFAILLFVSVLALTAFAAAEPAITSEDVGYIDYAKGNNTNDGQSAATAKKQLLPITSNGVISLVKDGGTIVVSGKMYVTGQYNMPVLGGALLITSNDGTNDYKNFEPKNNPACALKMSNGASMTLNQDTVIDDIILFQEYTEPNTITITSGNTLVIGEKVATVGSAMSAEPSYMALHAEKGSTLIVKAGTFQRITGDGEIIVSDSVNVIEKNTAPSGVNATVANALYFLGLVKGYDDSGSDFRLENDLTRAEAAVQVVRFLGAEKEALSKNYNLAFTDLPSWAVPYVGYAFEKGIVMGVSTTKFNPNGIITEAQFLTYLLRAMEYKDGNGGDFVWSDPFTLANSISLISHNAPADKFTRGSAFDICYNALLAKCKGGEGVADKFIKNGVITEKSLGYAKRIADGETIVVACVGDSVTQGTGSSPASKYSYPANLQKLLGKGFEVVNCGKASSYVMNLDSEYNVKVKSPNLWYPNTAEYAKLKGTPADILIVMLGTNDARSMTEPAAIKDFISSYKDLIADFATMETNPEIYISSMIPATNADITNQGSVYILPDILKEIAQELGLPFIPTHENMHDYYYVMLDYNDRVHPNNDSYPALAENFYKEVFDANIEITALPYAKSDVVYVAGSGKRTNDGATAGTAVDNLGLAIAMLRKNGGTVVVSGEVAVKETHLVECGGNITVTSVYGGVDYRAKNSAKLSVSGSVTLASALTLENLDIDVTASGKGFNCNYNNFTVANGVNCTGDEQLAINAGYRIGAGALSPEQVSAHKDCTISIASGTWSVLRGGNMRTSGTNPIGTIDKGVKHTVNISGGKFTYVGVNANTAVGMNGCDGDVYFNVSGGEFFGGVYGVHRTGTNSTGTTAAFNGNLYMNVTGGIFHKEISIYHTADTPEIKGEKSLVVDPSLADKVR